MNSYIALEIAIGHKLGLLSALKKCNSPVTSQELADSCKLKERYVREWLGSMSAAKFVSMTTNDKYSIPEACKPYIGRHSFLSSDLPNLAANTPAVFECFQNNGPKGFNYTNQMDCLIWLEEDKSECDGKWIDEHLFPVGEKTKDSICNILNFGCATGMLTINIAKHFPNAMVYGIGIEEIAIVKAKENKKKENFSNVEFVLSSGGLMDKT